jgi:hypothetical protein
LVFSIKRRSLTDNIEAYKWVSMFYKRNQVEEAISRTLGETSAKPSSELRTRVKRLLDADRNLGRTVRSSDPRENNYAFYTKVAPGKGAEVHFSGYEAFALMEGLRLMKHEWPQGFVVSIMREVRRDLEKRHRRILELDSDALFDPQLIRERNEGGAYAGTNSAQEFLLIVSDDNIREKATDRPYPMFFDDQRQAFEFQLKEPGRSCTWIELVTPAHLLRDTLKQTLPRQRGRSG